MPVSTGAAPLAAPATLMSLIWPSRSALRAAVLMLAGSALLALSAKVQVPFYPVPMTMQTLVVLVLGASYGWRLAGATVALYLVEGLVGLPVFAGPVAGPLYMAGPTGGFLVGFLVGAVLTGYLAERGFDRPLPRLVVTMCLGHAAIFACGLAWLAHLIPFEKAWAAGAAPFLWATVLKTALAVAVMQAGWTYATRTDEKR